MATAIRNGERFGARGPECKGSHARVKLRTVEQIHREYECSTCGRVLRVRLSERTGEATVPRHRAEREAGRIVLGQLVLAPACHVCGSDLWKLERKGRILCHGMVGGKECTEEREV